jgi:hypothetical protein
MRRIRVALLVLGFLAAVNASQSVGTQEFDGQKPKEKHKPRFTIANDSTYVIGPLDADGYPDYAAAMNERLSKGVTAENNANVLLWQALGPRIDGNKRTAEFFKKLGMAMPPENGDYFIALQQYLNEHAKLETGEPTDKVLAEVDHSTERAWTAKQFPHFAGWLKANEKPLALLGEATRRNRFFSPWQYSAPKAGPPGLRDHFFYAYRAIAHALTARAMLALGEERYDDAWRDLLASHRLGRLVGHAGNWNGWLIGIAIESIMHKAEFAYLDQAKPSAARLRECQRDLQGMQSRAKLADMFDLGQRIVFLDTVAQSERHGLGHLLDFFGTELLKAPDPLANQHLIDWDTAFRNANYWHNRLAASMRINDRAARGKLLDQIQEELRPLERFRKEGLDKALLGPGRTSGARAKLLVDFVFSFFVATSRKLMDAADRTEQNHRNLTIAMALAGYHREHGGYPKALESLVPDYLPKIPQDLFGTSPLTYRPSANGYLLYSVGVNGKDDGGRTYGDEPYGGDDLVVRMPLPPWHR